MGEQYDIFGLEKILNARNFFIPKAIGLKLGR